MIWKTGAIDLSKPSACQRTVQKKSKGGKRSSSRKLALEMDMSSFSSASRILRKDLKMKPYKITVEPLLKDEHKAQWKNSLISREKVPKREDTMRILFSDEKMFDLDGVYNSQNDRIWPVTREEANQRARKKNSKESLQKR